MKWAAAMVLIVAAAAAQAQSAAERAEWPRFVGARAALAWLGAEEPVIVLRLGREARAYPIQILMFHEIVNDEIAGRPVAVTFCPLCNASIVFERRIGGRTLDFGTTGRLRHSDLVMYDRQTESWWQQFTGEAIVGEYTGMRLALHPVSNRELAGVPYVVFARGDGMASPLDTRDIAEGRRIAAATAFERRLDGGVLEFETRDGRAFDRGSGSEWNILGEAIAGPLKGRRLAALPDSGVHFAFAWLAFNPDSEIVRALP